MQSSSFKAYYPKNNLFLGVFLAVMVEVLIKTSSALVWPLVNVYLKGDIEWEILIELLTAVIYLSVNIVSITCRCLQGAIAVNASFVYLLVQADIENIMKMEFNEEKFEETIINLIQYHQKINRLTCELRDIFTILYCGDLLAASQKLGCQGFTLMTINSIDIQRYFVQIWYIIKTVLSFFILYWPGQLLADMSARVATAAFSIRWYTKNRRISTLVNLIILRSQRPAHMTSKFELMTLRSFGKVSDCGPCHDHREARDQDTGSAKLRPSLLCRAPTVDQTVLS
ncbi:uncharacterized protein LOC114361589 isoform X2 [Ostrinia furnacalis]|uniref:uncharacterized protein LOC114361589 isoform X2 n=1 Tax=Ostrinia furnacalis TaxID=93504 RepID=UPI00103B3344|nr:uncharacterized protein LOC114361589 isoform X2 [Ostrinia furnacalis]XP_028172493.1 uncharacterized protein LOC114361589 isoform X2 [Ostrinia furnacalis]